MSWVLGLLGAVLGAIVAGVHAAFFGFVGGGLIGALLGQASGLRRRVGELEQRLARVEALARRPALGTLAATPEAATTPADLSPAPTPPELPVATAVPSAAAGVAAASVAEPAPLPQTGVPQPPAVPVAAAAPAPAWTPPPPEPPNVLERALLTAKAWLFEGNVPVKLGLLVLMFGVAALLKYGADAGWFTMPIEVRLSLVAAGAIAGLLWGLRTARERPAFGLSLQGGAIGVLLLTVFAAFAYYKLLDPMPAFAMIVILVAGASVLAVKQDAPALAVLGFIGGYLAPVLISTGSGNHVALFSYYAVLNTAVFLIAWKRPWRALNLIGFAFTFVIGGLWGAEYYRPEKFATVEPFLVLFFLFYVAIPVLYALAGREKNGKVDGTLLFGTPLLAFPMQAGLVGDDRMLLALSAVAVAAVYAGLAMWALRNPRLRLLARSAASMGVVFATLAIPLALSARWTSAAWALQGLGMVWLGLRQPSRLTRWSGLALLGLAGLAWGASLFTHDLGTADRFLANGHALNLVLLALTALAAAWFYERGQGNRLIAIGLFLLGLGWWTLLGMREIEVNLRPVSDATAYGLFAALSAMLAALLRKPLAWPRLSWPVLAACVIALPLSLAALDEPLQVWPAFAMQHWFAPPLLPWWGVAAVLLLSLRPLRDPRSGGLPFAHLAWLSMISLALGISLVRVLDRDGGLGDGWLLPAALAPVGLLFMAAWRRPAVAGWPLAPDFLTWRKAWLMMAGFALACGWLVGQFLPGKATPLAWLPVLNPLELFLIGTLALGIGVLREREARGHGKAGWSLWAGAALLTLTMSVLRACHHLADLPWSPGLLSDRIAQTSLTVAWCVAGVVTWILGSRRHNRPLWWIGAGLLGVVLLKLLLVDRQFLGNITGIVSFVAVGLLLIIVGRLAPTPPRSE
ncbi:DUF2339 domain-containing protein [Arenimonas sp. MALMAid1274]|uniref:DUF2339 domain-containing protein n=1 Tax=Arenimonas sp. MALMAid1274 TaxID=3411630 RepID=UPI003BA0F0E1